MEGGGKQLGSFELFVSGLGSRGREGFEDAICTASVLQVTLSSPSARDPALETETHVCVSRCLLGPPSYLVMREIMLPFNIRGDSEDLMKTHQPPPHPALFFFFFFFGFIWPHHEACGIFLPWPEIKPTAPASEAQNLNHWTTQAVLQSHQLDSRKWCIAASPAQRSEFE